MSDLAHNRLGARIAGRRALGDVSGEHVRAGEATLRAVFDTLPVDALVAEASGRVTGHNARMEEILGHGLMPSRPGESPGAAPAFARTTAPRRRRCGR